MLNQNPHCAIIKHKDSFIIYKRNFLLLFFFILPGCSQTYLTSMGSIKTTDGQDITLEFCTSDWIRYLELSEESHDLHAEHFLLHSEDHYSRLEGLELTSEDMSLLEKHSQLEEKRNRLVAKRNRLERRNPIPVDQLIETLKELNHLNRESIRFIDDLSYSSSERELNRLEQNYHSLFEEATFLKSKYSDLMAESFRFFLLVCDFTVKGYQLTPEGMDLAGEANQLLEENNVLNVKNNKLSKKITTSKDTEKDNRLRKEQIKVVEDMLDIMNKTRNIQKSILENFYKP